MTDGGERDKTENYKGQLMTISDGGGRTGDGGEWYKAMNYKGQYRIMEEGVGRGTREGVGRGMGERRERDKTVGFKVQLKISQDDGVRGIVGEGGRLKLDKAANYKRQIRITGNDRILKWDKTVICKEQHITIRNDRIQRTAGDGEWETEYGDENKLKAQDNKGQRETGDGG